MPQNSSFKAGNANGNQQNKATQADSAPKDEYYGRYKESGDGYSEAEKFGTSDNPSKQESLPAKGLRGVGG